MALRHAPKLKLPDGEILIVSPHPDDETLGAGGLIRSAATKGHAVSVVSVTDGEAAYSDWKELARIRRCEVDHALSILAPDSPQATRLGIPDGRVSEHRCSLYEAVDRIASSVALLVAPYELDGHPDHEATGEVCLEVARQRQLTIWRYPIWIWHHGSPERLLDQRWGRFYLDAAKRHAKHLAIASFASQLRPPERAAIIPPHVLPYFTRPYEAFLL
jgi:LmbE family N-acetylglucosaminyl deacetylase